MRGLITFVVLALLASLNGVEAGKKKKEVKARTLCPVDEIACPIIGSTCVGSACTRRKKSARLTPNRLAAEPMTRRSSTISS